MTSGPNKDLSFFVSTLSIVESHFESHVIWLKQDENSFFVRVLLKMNRIYCVVARNTAREFFTAYIGTCRYYGYALYLNFLDGICPKSWWMWWFIIVWWSNDVCEIQKENAKFEETPSRTWYPFSKHSRAIKACRKVATNLIPIINHKSRQISSK